MEENKVVFPEDKVILGLKIDVDTYKGTDRGVPLLVDILKQEGIRGSFFFSIGPDNMGRHVWRLLKPKFLLKMLRGNAAKLYGLDILLRGTFWPGQSIGKRLASIMRMTVDKGHEVALHALDHHKWQSKIARMSSGETNRQFSKAVKSWKEIFGKTPAASGTPGWQISQSWLEEEENDEHDTNWKYHSDCRGDVAGYPRVNGKVYKTIQIPTTLPTFDEVIGRNGINENNYNEYIFSLLRTGKLNVLTIHSEVEGGAYSELFRSFVQMCKKDNVEIIPMCELATRFNRSSDIPVMNMEMREIPGREGELAVLGNISQL